MPTVHSRSFLLAPALGLAMVGVYAAGQTPQVRPQQRPRPPYTAELKITHVQTLANGTTITNESTELEALDSQGRRLRSTTYQAPGPGEAARTTANVSDPVEGTQSSWESTTKKARVVRLPPEDQRKGCWTSDEGNMRMSWYEGPKPGAPAPNRTVVAGGGTIVPAQRQVPAAEKLGTTTIQGVEARGVRFTTTIAAGEMGNDQPIVSTNEVWSAPQFGLTVREVTDDPRTGKTTRELVSLTKGEPDPSLFEPPEGYEVVTEQLHQVSCPAAR